MKKFFKITAIVLVVIVLLMAAVPFLFKGKIKDLVLQQANQNLNAKVGLGDIRISLFRQFPRVYIGLEKLTITGENEFEGELLADFNTLAITVNLSDFFSGDEYRIEKILMVHPDIRLKVTEEGKANWDIFKSSEDTTASATTSATSSEPSSFRLKLKKVIIENGRLVYDDPTLETYMVLNGINHSLSGDLTADRTILRTSLQVGDAYFEYGNIAYLNKAVLNFEGTIDADLQNSVYQFEQNKFKINELLVELDGSVGMTGDDYNLLLTFKAPENKFRNFISLIPAIYSREFSTLQTDGNLSLEGYIKGIYNENTLPAFQLNASIDNAWFKYPELPGEVKDINMKLRIENAGGDADNTIVDVPKMSMNIMGNPLSLSLYLSHPITDLYLKASLNGKINLGDIQKYYPLQEGEQISGLLTADASFDGKISDLENGNYDKFIAFGSMLLEGMKFHTAYLPNPLLISNAQLNFSPAYIDLVSFTAATGSSNFNMKGKVSNYLPYILADKTLDGNLSLNADIINLNEFLESGTVDTIVNADTIPSSISDSSNLSAFIVPVNLHFNFNTSIDSLIYMNIHMANVKGTMEIVDHKLILNPLTFDLLKGQISLNGFYETSDPSNPLVNFKLKVNNVDIPEAYKNFALVEKFAPIFEHTRGTFSGGIDLSGILNSEMMPVYNTLTGSGRLTTSSLELSGINSLNQLADLSGMEQFKKLAVQGVDLSFNVAEGILNVKPFDLKSGQTTMTVSGWTSFNQDIGYDLKLKVPRSLFGSQANNMLNGLLAQANQLGTNFKIGDFINLNALVDGTLQNPKVKLNLLGSTGDTGNNIKEQIKQQVEEKVQEVKQDAKEQADKILADAEKQAQAVIDLAKKKIDEIMANAQKLADGAKKLAAEQSDNLVKQAKANGPLAEVAAKKAAEKIQTEAAKKSQQILDEARKQSDGIMAKAREEAAKIRQDANNKVKGL